MRPTSSVRLVLLRVMPETVTSHSADFSLFAFETAVILALPGATAETTPLPSTVVTVAMEGSLLVQVTVRSNLAS